MVLDMPCPKIRTTGGGEAMKNFSKGPFDHDNDEFPDIFDLGLGYQIMKESMEDDDEDDWNDEEKDDWDDDDDDDWDDDDK